MQEQNPLIKIVEVVLALALLGALFFAGWRIYRSLPADGAARIVFDDAAANSELTIVVRDGNAVGPTKVELYPIDFTTIQREFALNTHPGKTMEDFLAQRLKNLVPVQPQMDRTGRAVAKLSEGNWWMRATSASSTGESIEWRLPVLISQRTHTIELSIDNAYERSKKF
ncbi:MAG: hypothetical protein DMF72_12195 [Acidobacteria bacterium]|nr:MAG: hypothetical protein DMF72_12195 [Acidobacteriota bacterium]